MPSVADRHAVAMSQQRFLPNNDAITITDTDKLINGQHRLHGVVKSGKTVSMLVCVGLPETVESNGYGTLYTIDTMDRGKVRAVGQQLTLRHGLTCGNIWAGAANLIGFLAGGNKINSATCDVAQALKIIELYQKQLDFTVGNKGNDTGIKTVPFIARIAFGMVVEPSLSDFYLQVISGENLTKKMPAYALRRYLTTTSSVRRMGDKRKISTQVIMQAAWHFVSGNSVKLLKASDLGREYFAVRQKANVRKVLEILAGT